MKAVGVRELRERTTEILKEVSEKGEAVQVTHYGRVMAVLVPPPRRTSPEEIEAHIAGLRDLARRIGERVTEPTDSSTIMQEERRWS